MNSYLVPQIVYVGDRATLILPFTSIHVAGARETSIALDPNFFPFSADIEFYRIMVEHRSSGSRLVVEFSAYAPGILELPPIEIDGELFTGIKIEITSIIGSGESGAVLSGPALPLAIPGTSLLIYGTMSAAILILLLVLWLRLRGRGFLKGWIDKWRRKQLIISMSAIEKRLRRALLKKDENQRDILNTLSGEFRAFLSFFTGENCRAMTAREIGHIPQGSLIQWQPDAADDAYRELSGHFLEYFFYRCDSLRFSGSEIQRDDTLAMLGDLRRFLVALDRAAKIKSRPEETAA
ncbi:MAG: hypothetical protein LBH97_02600 [Treponema sp.]|jgi:hypothetical protein|nr:hypothetical protein [Treponema sp.]